MLTVSGQYGYKPPLPAQGGSEGVGIVDALGEGVQNVSVGQRVAASGLKGAWAEFAVAKGASCVPMPEAIDDETAAQLIAMPLSALTLLEFTAFVKGSGSSKMLQTVLSARCWRSSPSRAAFMSSIWCAVRMRWPSFRNWASKT